MNTKSLLATAAAFLVIPFALAEKPKLIDLFNGEDLTGWQNRNGEAPGAGWVAEDGVLARNAKAGDIWTKERYGDFILTLEFKTAGNSGVFIRTDNPRNNVQTGIEIQVNNPSGPSKHSVGAIYDLVSPS